MTQPALKHEEQQRADFTVSEGCILCGGEMAFRVTAKGAATCCLRCRWISKPQVDLSGDGLRVEYVPAGRA